MSPKLTHPSKMKITAYLLLGAYATTALAAIYPVPGSDAEAEAKTVCGELGVMYFDPADLPEGVTPADVRMCRKHPLGRLPTPGADWVGNTLRGWLPSWVF
ncbi:hypothetical protein BJX76DRAFT_362138 [Aspergillus varians]